MNNENIQVKKSFTGRSDQKKILESMIKMMKHKYPQYNDMTENDLVYMIFEAVAYSISGLNYRSDKNYLGLNPKTADTETQKANIISSFGGSLDFFRGSYGYVKAYLKDDYEEFSVIKKYTEVVPETKDKFKYYVYKDLILNSENVKSEGDNKKFVILPVRQGEVKKVNFNSTAVVEDRLVIYDKDTLEKGVAFESMEVYNQGIWTQTEDVYFENFNSKASASENRLYSVTKDLDRTPIIQFITGWKDLLSDFITNTFEITYAVSVGNKSSVSDGIVCKVSNPNIKDAVSLGSIRGGYTPTYDLSVQVSRAVQESRTMWTAVTIQDFRILSKENPDVLDSKVFDIDSPKINEINQYLNLQGQAQIKPLEVVVSFVGNDGEIPNEFLVKEVMNKLNDRKINLLSTRYVEPNVVHVNYDIVIKTIGESITISKDEVYGIIEKLYTVSERFGILPVSDSKIIASIQNISQNIYSVEVTRNETSTINVCSFSKLGEITVTNKVV